MFDVKTVALHALKATAAAVDVARRPPSGLVVLLYHRVGTTAGTEAEVSLDTFQRQMEALATWARIRSLGQGLDELDSLGDSTVSTAVTFDDGTADFVDHALPVLVHHRVPATLYVATDFIERRRPFSHDGSPASWAGLADAVSTGLVTIGSHTHSHRLLDKATPSEAIEELDRSKGLIEDRLGVTAEHFAYPKGRPASAPVELEVRARFRSAALGRVGVNRPRRTDRYRLRRSPIQASDTDLWFRRKVAGGLSFEGTVREALNQRRYEGATT